MKMAKGMWCHLRNWHQYKFIIFQNVYIDLIVLILYIILCINMQVKFDQTRTQYTAKNLNEVLNEVMKYKNETNCLWTLI